MPSRILQILPDRDAMTLRVGDKTVVLTNLNKMFWQRLGFAKRDLLQYYATVASVLVPHLRDRAMVMKRYPDGADGKCFFMKHAPDSRPTWMTTCNIEHASGNIVKFPMVQDVASLLWLVNLGCIDLNQWYARCDDVGRPDYLHFDLDPGKGAPFERVLEVSLIVRDVLRELALPVYIKTSGATGVHVYVPIRRGPTQKQVWTFAKALALMIAERHPKVVTAEYIIAKRPRGRVLVDYNQNAWGKTLASVYSVRPTPQATVSTPLTWDEVERGITVDQFTIETVPERIRDVGDLWKPLLMTSGRARLESFI